MRKSIIIQDGDYGCTCGVEPQCEPGQCSAGPPILKEDQIEYENADFKKEKDNTVSKGEAIDI
jgi:hypothetical protein